MSEENNNLPEIVVNPIKMTDISDESMKKVQKFIDNGEAGMIKIEEEKIAKMMDLYLSGKTYDQISNITRTDRITVMYLSHRMNWCERRKEYMSELADHMKRRIIEAKLVMQDHLLQLAQMYQKKHGHKIIRYLETNNEEFTDQISLKEIDRYLKIADLIQKSMAEPPKDKGPMIGLNISDGATVTRKGDNQIEITPKAKAIGDVLKHYADLRREEENK
jgi:hypothetical protein